MLELLKLRSRQIDKVIKSIGWFYIAFLVGIVSYGYYLLYRATAETPSGYKVALILVCHFFILLFIQLERKDNEFIRIVFSNSYKLILFEYFILSLPIIAISLLNRWQMELLFYCTAISILPSIEKYKFMRGHWSILTFWVPECNFEYRAAIRKLWIVIPFLFCSGIYLAFYRNLVLVPIILFILLLPKCYEDFEPGSFLATRGDTPDSFLFRKIKCHLNTFLLFCAPLFVISWILGTIQVLFILAILFIALTAIAWLNIVKYSYYTPNERSFRHKMISNLVLLGIFPLPFFIPIVFIFIAMEYPRSVANLEKYLNDRD
jgi:hypothetical protein